MRVLITEDDADLRVAISVSLRGAGLAVDAVADLPGADEALAVNTYDCAVFDRMLPSGDSLPFVGAQRRAGSRVPVLFLTARDAVADRIAGLEHGDDYLVKPFAMAELIARVYSLCRRTPARPPAKLVCGDVELDTGRHEARRGGVLLTLTSKEFAVLELLISQQGQPVSRADLIARCWDAELEPRSNLLDVLIAQLRRKLRAPAVIHTVRGVGYRIDPG
ncbi:response regulator transcription factor [Amycolatopsis sp. GM8]|uniref:winged helix-turn-helix domain-containing protein n=1 Tax=Amycolatopsis sp. GM8 TaxID=2896530 RepID=UPI001F1F4301|nr:response regulator transcription factor [Amycolatopsis sp. GM8]